MPALSNAKWRTPEGYYVYQLVNPADGKPFYVGKGKGKRALQHATDAKRGTGCNDAKRATILAIRASGAELIIDIIEEGLTEKEAYTLERRLIAAGEELTNIALGSYTHLENVARAARQNLLTIKPLCQMWKEGSSSYRMMVWGQVNRELQQIARMA